MKLTNRNTFIQQNMGLVGMVARRHAYRTIEYPHIDRDDLVSIGTIGLIKAFDRFNPSYEVKFSTYAVPIIEGEIKRYFRDSLETVRFTRRSKFDYYTISDSNLENEKPSIIADTLDLPITRVIDALDYYRCKFAVSLDREVYQNDGATVTLADRMGIEVDFDSDLEIEIFLNGLDERTRKIVELRLQGLTQVEISKATGTSQGQISKYLLKLHKKLKLNIS